MKQVVQSARRGRLTVEEVPAPTVRPGHLLVRSRASLISAGTERLALRFAAQNVLQKARSRPDLVRKTLAKAKRDGVAATVRAVMARLDEPLPMGYSAAGVVEAVGDGLAGRFRVGQRVAVAGAGQANHAEVNVVPANLAALVPDDVVDEEACYATMCAIAMHGVRHTRPELGGWCAVVGVGLVGQLATQLLALAGVRVLALDYDVGRLRLAQRHGAEAICDLGCQDAAKSATAATGGMGCDGVVIAAASDSAAPFETAEQVARDRAIVSLIGNTGTAFGYREFMQKELTVVTSRSYGPGRYDADYETRGVKYPPGFVRWTETENLKAALELMRDVRPRRLMPGALTTHRFEFEQAASAYALIESGEPALGVVLRYGSPAGDQQGGRTEDSNGRAEALAAQAQLQPKAKRPPQAATASGIAVGHCTLGVVGAGAFARATLLPALARMSNCRLHTVVAASGVSAQRSRERFGFEQAATDAQAVFDNPDIDAVLLATPHGLHAEHAVRALAAQKHVLVEKPLCLTRQELAAVVAAASASAAFFQVGFNRRFAPLALAAQRHLAAQPGPCHILLRVNAGALAEDSWQRDAAEGGRILGEACHFIDLGAFLGGAPVVSVAAEGLRSEGVGEDVTVVAELANGSSATLFYTTLGDHGYGKELIEAYAGGSVVRIEDFRRLTVAGGPSRGASGRGLRGRQRRQDKGHRQQLQAFVAAVAAGGPAPVSEAQLVNSSLATIAVRESLAEGSRVLLGER